MKVRLYSLPAIVLSVFFLFPTNNTYSADNIQDKADFSSVEERRLHNSIQEELSNIESQRNVLLMREKELKTLEDGVDKKIAEVDMKLEELKGLKKQIESLLADKSIEEKKRIQSLSKIYDKMDPEKAAFAISGMEDELATELLASMKVKSAAKVLDRLSKLKATQLSSKFSQIQIE